MATTLQPSPTDHDPAIESLLGRLRRRIRAYVCTDGMARIVVALGAGFWASLALDWTFELPVLLRAVVLMAVALATGYVVYRFLFVPLAVRLADRNMALLLERKFAQFDDGLLTAVEMAERPELAAGFGAEMLSHTRRGAQAHAEGINVTEVLNAATLVRHVTLALALAGSVGLFVAAAPNSAAVWARRNLLLSSELWPRATHLYVRGLDDDGHVKIARGADWTLAVEADAAPKRVVPEVVEVRYQTNDGARGSENMSREGAVLPGEADFQPYSHTFRSVLSPLEFYVFGGDDREGPYYLDVVESPTISRMTLHCEYPAYMNRVPRDLPVAGLMQLPEGTEVTILAEANKPLLVAQIDDVTDDAALRRTRIDLAAENGAPAERFEHRIPPLTGDLVLQFTLFDTDGIESLESVRLAISAVSDEPPEVDVGLKGIGTAVTPEARLPAAGTITDDYGVARIWFEYHADDAVPRKRPFPVEAKEQEAIDVSDALEIGELQLQPKQKLHVAVLAADACTLGSGANEGSSQRYLLDVVSAEQLRSMLEARELMLRRRFETIVEEFTATRNRLAETELATPEPPAEQPATPSSSAPAQAGADPVLPQRVAVTRVAQNVERSAHETLAVAEAFEEIRAEMINNRVDTEELKIRLKEGVADPLKQIVEGPFPVLEAELERLIDQLSDPQAAQTTRAAAVAQMDAILVQMSQVLDKMLELETFNEVLDMLRAIIEEQEQINTDTKDQRKQRLRDLLE